MTAKPNTSHHHETLLQVLGDLLYQQLVVILVFALVMIVPLSCEHHALMGGWTLDVDAQMMASMNRTSAEHANHQAHHHGQDDLKGHTGDPSNSCQMQNDTNNSLLTYSLFAAVIPQPLTICSVTSVSPLLIAVIRPISQFTFSPEQPPRFA